MCERADDGFLLVKWCYEFTFLGVNYGSVSYA